MPKKYTEAEWELMNEAWYWGYTAHNPQPKDSKELEAWDKEAQRCWLEFCKAIQK